MGPRAATATTDTGMALRVADGVVHLLTSLMAPVALVAALLELFASGCFGPDACGPPSLGARIAPALALLVTVHGLGGVAVLSALRRRGERLVAARLTFVAVTGFLAVSGSEAAGSSPRTDTMSALIAAVHVMAIGGEAMWAWRQRRRPVLADH